ncbi:MAG TPA: alpha/beta hydrolase [Terracidiphilus sp.]|nr:alpha/beta hydrolase [Terracidiphilus sp.]
MKLGEIRETKPMDAELRRYLDSLSAVGPVLDGASTAERVQMRRSLMMKALEGRGGAIPGLPNGVATREVEMTGGPMGRLYFPLDAAAPLPVLVYLHGGGWAAGSVETHDPFCRLLCGEAGVIILAVEYRLAPEHAFPAALEDTLTAFRWVAENASSFGGDAKRLALGGDSAGANLAAVAANRICAANDSVRPAALMLLYPVMDHPSAGHSSYRERGTGCGLEASLMEWFWNLYLAGAAPENPEISPLRIEALPALPPTLVATAEYDPLRDEGVKYAHKLAAAGVKVRHLHAEDMHHNFPVHPGTVMRFPQSVASLKEFADWLKTALSC